MRFSLKELVIFVTLLAVGIGMMVVGDHLESRSGKAILEVPLSIFGFCFTFSALLWGIVRAFQRKQQTGADEPETKRVD